jgi:uncharacterized protein (DUF39 family)
METWFLWCVVFTAEEMEEIINNIGSFKAGFNIDI